MLKFFINPALKYAYLRTFKATNVLILPTFRGRKLVDSIKVKKF